MDILSLGVGVLVLYGMQALVAMLRLHHQRLAIGGQ